MLDKAVPDSPAMHPGRSARTLKMHFIEPVTFGFFWFFNNWTVRDTRVRLGQEHCKKSFTLLVVRRRSEHRLRPSADRLVVVKLDKPEGGRFGKIHF